MIPPFDHSLMTTRTVAAAVPCSPQYLRRVLRERGLHPDRWLVSERRNADAAIPLYTWTRLEEIRSVVAQAKIEGSRKKS
jgi:hypothetical protein